MPARTARSRRRSRCRRRARTDRCRASCRSASCSTQPDVYWKLWPGDSRGCSPTTPSPRTSSIAAAPIGDDPVARPQLRGARALVRDRDRVREHVAIVARRRLLGQIHATARARGCLRSSRATSARRRLDGHGSESGATPRASCKLSCHACAMRWTRRVLYTCRRRLRPACRRRKRPPRSQSTRPAGWQQRTREQPQAIRRRRAAARSVGRADAAGSGRAARRRSSAVRHLRHLRRRRAGRIRTPRAPQQNSFAQRFVDAHNAVRAKHCAAAAARGRPSSPMSRRGGRTRCAIRAARSATAAASTARTSPPAPSGTLDPETVVTMWYDEIERLHVPARRLLDEDRPLHAGRVARHDAGRLRHGAVQRQRHLGVQLRSAGQLRRRVPRNVLPTNCR